MNIGELSPENRRVFTYFGYRNAVQRW